MKTPHFRFTAPLVAVGLFGLALSAARADDPKELLAVLVPTEGNKTKGVVTFTELPDDKVKVVAHVEGLDPNSKHGFHVHQFGDLTAPDGMATGGHFNPEKHDHALPDHKTRHAGDFGNLEANAGGVADFEIIVDNIDLAGDDDAVLGRGVIVHAKPDDGGQPTGNAGARLAQGVIGIKQTTDK
jgi:superoxide dismutase, Cu-Zn family